MHDLNGKTVLVTGGARRIGREIALAMADAGARVAFTYLHSQADAQQTYAELEAKGNDAMCLFCDVRDQLSVNKAIDEIVAAWGGLDVLVNNAGIYESAAFEEITPEQWENMFLINTRGPYLVTRTAASTLRTRGGRVINIGSLGGMRPWETHAHYSTSKAALNMLTQIMAKALAPDIAVNCVAPGMISMTAKAEMPDWLRAIAEKTPMRRPGGVADVVEAVMFFATATRFITGQVLAVDGGLGLQTL